MKKKSAIFSPARQVFIIVCVVLFLLAFLRLHFQSRLQSLIYMYRPSRFFSADNFKGTPKIAFLFLARQSLPLDFVWDIFFKNVDTAKFSIHVHSQPGFVFNESNSRSAFFHGRQLNNSIQVVWGESSMIEAEKLLLEAALDDPANRRFVLLSDSCIPLYSFGYVYSYLMSSPKSFVDSFIDGEEHRYNPEMSPFIPEETWRKGSQWITLIRRHAIIVVDDSIVFPVFREFCKRWPPADLINRRPLLQAFKFLYLIYLKVIPKGHNCIPDEHYVQTLLNMEGLDKEIERRTLTYSLWNSNHSAEAGNMSSWHPFQFDYADATPQIIREIKDINHVYYKFEKRKELCHVNSTNAAAPCFLFARKFTPRAAVRLLTERSVELDAAAAFHSSTLNFTWLKV